MVSFIPRSEPDLTPLAGFPGWFSALLRARGIRTEEAAEAFLHPAAEQLHDPLLMPDMAKAVRLIRAAVENRDPILVWGDYDVDGISATALMVETLREEGADVSFYLPDRHGEGYGLNEEALRSRAGNARLLITVDCGISNHREVTLARELGMKVIVTDHHQLPETLPEADAVLNPLLGGYPFRSLCGAGVALKVCHALQGPEGMKKRLDLAALATVADIVPLLDENRVIVTLGLRQIAAGLRPGLKALLDTADITPPLASEDLAFRLGPRLNAAGRLEDASQGVRLLLTREEGEARSIALHLDRLNRRRQEEEREITRQALIQIQSDPRSEARRVLIAQGEGWNPGLIGLAAGKICERFHRPTIVLTLQDGAATGSCRSVPGVDIFRMLSLCGELVLRFGGHEQAAGLTLPADRIDELRERLDEAIREHCPEDCFRPTEAYDLEMPFSLFTPETLGLLDLLEPCGFGNPAPQFLTRNVSAQELRRVGRDRSHLKLTLLDGAGVRMDGIAFSMGEIAEKGWDRLDVLGCPGRNEWNGRTTVQLTVRAIRPAEADADGLSRTGGSGQPSAPELIAFFGKIRAMQEKAPFPAKKTGTGFLPAGAPGLRFLKTLALPDDTLRGVYRLIRDTRFRSLSELAASADLSEAQVLTALRAFEETSLVRWQLQPFGIQLLPPVRCSMDDSPTLRFLRTLG